ncbi:uncharacterized protein LOC126374808 [Pectinophora gossypiella]|uniref:uncharacterized protein LOC126374808 n=1 Tax=Pectinophora gossypiella TaxID=13191 RepID=UPI00214E9B71|nr:uncharacterized protein LOC126374808 [Pectinophora gossypiella]
MKTALVVLALVAVGYAAPQPRKLFHEHLEDFLDVVREEAGAELEHIFEHYLEFEEFVATLDYLATADYKELIYEMESLPEFKAVVDFLEKDNIDIMFFVDLVNEMLEQQFPPSARKVRHELSGTDYSAFINDIIDAFPKEKLAALYEEKIAEYDDFRVALENLESQEWQDTWNALWNSEVFQKEIQTLESHGIYFNSLIKELRALFGQ